MAYPVEPEEIKHIAGFENPDDMLLLPADILSLFEKYTKWEKLLPHGDIRISRLCSTPIILDKGQRPPMELISHPLMWLGERQTKTLLDEQDVPENLDHLVLRVALELLVSNVYTPGTGWVDCLSLMGLDAQRDHARIQAWIDGGSDEVLDTFNLDEVLNSEDEPAWSFELATKNYDAMMDVSFGLMARSAAQTAREVLEAPEQPAEGEPWTPEARRRVLCFVAQIAYIVIGGSNGKLPDYSERIAAEDDVTHSNSFAWEFVSECERLAQHYESVETDLIADFQPLDVDEFEAAVDGTSPEKVGYTPPAEPIAGELEAPRAQEQGRGIDTSHSDWQ